jgi:transposase
MEGTMARTIKFSAEDVARAHHLRDVHTTESEYRAALVFLMMSEQNKTANEVANFFGISLKTVFDDMDKIRKPESVSKGVWGGGNNHLLSFEEEQDFLDIYFEKAVSGHIISMPEIHMEFNKLVQKETPKSTFYRMLKRHGWRKVLPDTIHAKADPEEQELFKKKPLRWRWQKHS